MDNPVLQQVQKLIKLGFNVLPVQSGTKRPEPNPRFEWKEYQSRRATAEEIQAWFGSGKFRAYGSVMGEICGLVALDLESETAISWALLNVENTPLKSKSGGKKGGQHWFYRKPPGVEFVPTDVKNAVKFKDKAGREVDADIRADGGFLLLPGSLHPDGGIYQEITPFESIDIESVPFFNPEWIPGCLKERAGELPRDICSDTYNAPPGSSRQVIEFLDRLKPIPHGRRYVAYRDTALQVKRGFGMTDEVTFQLMRDMFLPKVDNADGKGHDEDLLRKLIAGVDKVSTATHRPGYMFEFKTTHPETPGWASLTKEAPEKPKTDEAAAFFDDPENFSKETDWAAPQPLPVKDVAIPMLPPFMVHQVIRNHIMQEARALNTSLEFFVGFYTTMFGSLIADKIAVYPKQHDKWHEKTNLWAVAIAPPSSKKSPALESAQRFLQFLTEKANAKFATLKKEHQKQINSATKNKEWDLLEELKASAPKKKVYEVNDATVPRLHQILADNPSVFLCRDELVGWLNSFIQQGHEQDRSYFLKGWAGKSWETVDRKGSKPGEETSVMARPIISIAGCVTPAVWQEHVRDAVEHGGGDGLMPRFNVVSYPSKFPTYEFVDEDKNSDEIFHVMKIMEFLDRPDLSELAGIPPLSEIEQSLNTPIAMRFSMEAFELWKIWHAKNHDDIVLYQSKSEAVGSHVAKYSKLVCAQALIFHMLDLASGREVGNTISVHAFRLAAAMTEFYHLGALRSYGYALETTLHRAHAFVEKIKTGDIKNGDKIRDLYRTRWAGLETKDKMESVLLYLEAMDWLRVEEVKPLGGGRPSQILKFNPLLDFTEKAVDSKSEMFKSAWLTEDMSKAHYEKYPVKERVLPTLPGEPERRATFADEMDLDMGKI